MKYVIKGIKVIDAGSMSGDLDSGIINSAQGDSSVSFLDNIGFQFVWTGTPTGTIAVLASIDGINFTALDFSPVITQPAGSASSSLANVNQFPFKWIKVTYTRESGSGSLTAWMSAREI
jgi:hypothetical protein